MNIPANMFTIHENTNALKPESKSNQNNYQESDETSSFEMPMAFDKKFFILFPHDDDNLTRKRF